MMTEDEQNEQERLRNLLQLAEERVQRVEVQLSATSIERNDALARCRHSDEVIIGLKSTVADLAKRLDISEEGRIQAERNAGNLNAEVTRLLGNFGMMSESKTSAEARRMELTNKVIKLENELKTLKRQQVIEARNDDDDVSIDSKVAKLDEISHFVTSKNPTVDEVLEQMIAGKVETSNEIEPKTSTGDSKEKVRRKPSRKSMEDGRKQRRTLEGDKNHRKTVCLYDKRPLTSLNQTECRLCLQQVDQRKMDHVNKFHLGVVDLFKCSHCDRSSSYCRGIVEKHVRERHPYAVVISKAEAHHQLFEDLRELCFPDIRPLQHTAYGHKRAST